jgi:hypothetical protein
MPFRASEAHRQPQSPRYVSAVWGEVKAQAAGMTAVIAI